jgi:hypothetical protein
MPIPQTVRGKLSVVGGSDGVTDKRQRYTRNEIGTKLYPKSLETPSDWHICVPPGYKVVPLTVFGRKIIVILDRLSGVGHVGYGCR